MSVYCFLARVVLIRNGGHETCVYSFILVSLVGQYLSKSKTVIDVTCIDVLKLCAFQLHEAAQSYAPICRCHRRR